MMNQSLTRRLLMVSRSFYLIVGCVLVGCSGSYQTFSDDEEEQQLQQETNRFVSSQLVSHLGDLEKELNDFSKFFLYQGVELKMPDRSVLQSDNYVLNRTVFIDWSGPVEQLLSDFSKLTGYDVQIIGASPIIPPIVTLHHERIKLLDVIRDVAVQVHKKADLVVYPDERLIEIRYH